MRALRRSKKKRKEMRGVLRMKKREQRKEKRQEVEEGKDGCGIATSCEPSVWTGIQEAKKKVGGRRRKKFCFVSGEYSQKLPNLVNCELVAHTEACYERKVWKQGEAD